jgi:hypothetical protein
MSERRYTSSTSPGVPTGSNKRSESITWEIQHLETETTQALYQSTQHELLKETLTSLRKLATELDKDRWKYE